MNVRSMNLMDESGQTLVLGAMFFAVLMGFLALAVDVTWLYSNREKMQIAADSAAAAAALDYKYGESNNAQNDATLAAQADGLPGTISVTVNNPPKNGFHESAGYTEAIVSEPVPTFFMRVFKLNAVTVSARSVVGSSVNGGCVWTLARSGTDVSLSGNGGLTASNCDIYDNSSASDAMSVSGNGSITAKAIGIVGGYSESGNGKIHPSPPTTGISPAADPINISPPSTTGDTCTGSNCNPNNSGNNNMTLQPGTYTSITNSGNGSLTLAPGNYIITGSFNTSGNGAVTIGAGEYSVGGNLSLQGNGGLTGTGVTFFTGGSTTIAGNGNMNLSAPTSGEYSGVLIAQSPTDSHAMSITGNGSALIKGIVYAPDAAVTLTGNGNLNVSLDLISDSLVIAGNGSITLTNYAAVDNTSSVLGKLAMVE